MRKGFHIHLCPLVLYRHKSDLNGHRYHFVLMNKKLYMWISTKLYTKSTNPHQRSIKLRLQMTNRVVEIGLRLPEVKGIVVWCLTLILVERSLTFMDPKILLVVNLNNKEGVRTLWKRKGRRRASFSEVPLVVLETLLVLDVLTHRST